MARGRPAGSKATKAIRLADLNRLLPDGATIMVSVVWLRGVEELYNVRFVGPAEPTNVSTMDHPEEIEGGIEAEAAPRERLMVEDEEL